jgi:biopolymer transport protein ExbB
MDLTFVRLFFERNLPEAMRPWLETAWPIWGAGGWAMAPLAAIGLIMYPLGLNTMFQLLLCGARHSPERAWRGWLKRPERPRGPVQRIIAEAMRRKTLHELEAYFALFQAGVLGPFTRNVQVMSVCVTTAPLIGLLGTVTGMLKTFYGLGRGSGGDQTMGFISQGISEALITTETGLVLALTGLFIQFFLGRQHQRFLGVLTRVESLCVREFQRRSADKGNEEEKP